MTLAIQFEVSDGIDILLIDDAKQACNIVVLVINVQYVRRLSVRIRPLVLR